MKTNLILVLAIILKIGGGATLVIFMNSLWDDSKLLTYVNLDAYTGRDTDHYSHNSASETNAL